MMIWVRLLYLADFIRGLAALVFIILIVAALLRRVRFVVTERGDRTEYSLEWGLSAVERLARELMRVLARRDRAEARRVAVGR